MTDTRRTEYLEAMIDAAADFYRFGWLQGASGNMSCRLGDSRWTITATGRHLRALDPQDFVDIDAHAEPTDGGEPSQDADTHLAIYDRVDDAGAIYHIHHLEAALCSDRDRKRGFTHLHEVQMIDALGLDDDGDEPTVNLPIIEARYDELTDAVAEALDDDNSSATPCLNIKNHGLYIWGATPDETRRHVEACAYLFSYAWRRPMSPKKSASISGFDL